MVNQKKIKLGPYPRGFHVITNEVVTNIPKITGIVNVFIQHTSAGLTINENAEKNNIKLGVFKLVAKKAPIITPKKT